MKKISSKIAKETDGNSDTKQSILSREERGREEREGRGCEERGGGAVHDEGGSAPKVRVKEGEGEGDGEGEGEEDESPPKLGNAPSYSFPMTV